jgi:hypothetical protein
MSAGGEGSGGSGSGRTTVREPDGDPKSGRRLPLCRRIPGERCRSSRGPSPAVTDAARCPVRVGGRRWRGRPSGHLDSFAGEDSLATRWVCVLGWG